MRKSAHVPGNHTLMPIIIQILQENNGTLSFSQVIYMVMFKHDLPQKLFKKARTEVGYSGTYLRKVGALRTDVKIGVWTLTDEYMTLNYDEAKKMAYAKYDQILGR